MAARKHPITNQLPVDDQLVSAVRAAAQRRAARNPAWGQLLDDYRPQELQQIIGRATTVRGAIWQAAQAVKVIEAGGRVADFVHDGRQMDDAVATTVAAAEYAQACDRPAWHPKVAYSDWLARQPLALPAARPARPKRDYAAEYRRRKARQLQGV